MVPSSIEHKKSINSRTSTPNAVSDILCAKELVLALNDHGDLLVYKQGRELAGMKLRITGLNELVCKANEVDEVVMAMSFNKHDDSILTVNAFKYNNFR